MKHILEIRSDYLKAGQRDAFLALSCSEDRTSETFNDWFGYFVRHFSEFSIKHSRRHFVR
jgi:hypothetical protein